ncbi:unnamed protein product [Haemonchus placei]|uniref:POLAc domain-containing protein n=1 Tax=Haemonchus placei TaxID=6290 RepID=A0A0N4WMK4_HAEPC|nr:unnamed protein product [Haemonchus placei]
MCFGGFCFDRALCSSLIQRLKKNIEQLESDCFSLIGHQFNLDSSKQVSEVLFSRLKLACPGGSSTKKHLSTSKAILEQMEKQHPIVSNILRYRRLKHALTVINSFEQGDVFTVLVLGAYKIYLSTG